MGSIGNPKAWEPYINSRDCSQGFCSLYCPQWCYIIFPPPPPLEFPNDDSSPNFSPLVISIIGILASAFLLVSYYTIISKYCGRVDPSRRRENQETAEELEDNHSPSLHEPWQTATTGLDEALIKSITVCKFKKGDGLVDGTDCSVCLSEFQEDETLRLLPKCSHAFHVYCIDTWLRSHSNCPLCRANIIFIGASPVPLPPPVTRSPPINDPSALGDSQTVPNENAANASTAQNTARDAQELESVQNDGGRSPKTPLRAFSDLGNVQGRDAIIEIREEGYHQQMRRSVSMDHSNQCQCRLSVSDILQMNGDDEDAVVVGEPQLTAGAGSSKQTAEAGKSSNKRWVLHCVMNPIAMKRSFSSGRFFLTRQGRATDTTFPL